MRKTLLGTIAGFVAGVMVAMAMPGFAADTQDPEPVAEEKPITLVVNGQEITLPDAQPRIVDGQVMVPVLAFAEVAGFAVEWDEGARALKVTTAVAAPQPDKTANTPSKQTYPLTITENDITYYEAETLRALLKSKNPTATIGIGTEFVGVGSKFYPVSAKVVGQRGYLDVRSLIEAEVITAEDLATYYGK